MEDLRSANDLMQDYQDMCTNEYFLTHNVLAEPRFTCVTVREVLSWSTFHDSLAECLYRHARRVLGEELEFEIELIGLGEDTEFLICAI